MKKLLALVLALVMTLGLATVAANASFPDAADIDLTEAADVMAAVGVFKGDEKGNFAPKANLSRDAAAKLIAYLALGEKVAEALPAVKVFDDVPATHWAAKYIAYCADAGYIAGDGNGNFLPTGALTGYAFGKMVLCALGYDAQIEGFVGSAWTLKVAKLMEENKINKGVSGDASAVLTREQAAQYCLNALKATMVKYDDKSVISIGDVKIEQSSKASKVAADEDYNTIKDDDYMQLGEKLYKGDLVFDEAAEDEFGRPAHEWTYDDKTVTVADKPVATFTAATKAAAVATALKGYKVEGHKINNIDKYIVEDEALVANANGETLAKKCADQTKNGLLIEVYADDDKEITDVVVIPYWNAKVTDVKTDKKTGDVTYTLEYKYYDDADHEIKTETVNPKDYADEDKDDEISFTTAPAKNDYVTVTFNEDDVAVIYPTTKVEGAVTSAKGAEKLTIGGTSYETNYRFVETAAEGFGLTDKTATAYIDQFGFVSAFKGPSNSGDKSIIITDVYTSLESGKLVDMFTGVTSNGEEKTDKWVKPDGKDFPEVQGVFTYDVNDDDKYEFEAYEDKALADDVLVYLGDDGFKASDKKALIDDGVYGYFTSDVKVIFVKDNGKYTVSEGMQKIADGLDVYAVLKKSSGDATYYIDTLYVAGAASAASTSSDDVIFVKGTTGETVAQKVDGKNKTFYLYNAYLKGEKIDNFYSATNGVEKAFYTKDVETASGAYIFEGNLYTEDSGTAAVTNFTISTKVNAQNILTAGGEDYVVANTVIVNATGNDELDVDSISDLNDAIGDGDAFLAFAIYNEKTMEISYLYIVGVAA